MDLYDYKPDLKDRRGEDVPKSVYSDDRKTTMAKGLRTKLLAASAYIKAADRVVRVATDAPVTLSTPTDRLPLVAADPERTAELATRFGVESSIARLQKALDTLPG